jgi:predicted ATPase
VVGETPNLAARLQALAEPGAVVIASSTQRLTGGLFEYRDLETVSLKGFAENVPAWQVLGAGVAESRFEAFHSAALTPIVGRDEEIDLLMRRWEQAKRGDGCLVLISGEPGIGKSRLTVALQERLQGEPHTRLRYFCSPQHTDSALYPVIRQLERAAEFERDDTPDAKLDRLFALLEPSPGHERDIQLLAELLSILTSDRYAPLDWNAQRKKDETFKALLRQLEALSRERPVAMIYEGAHWIDPNTRELLDLAVERVARLPVLLVVTLRPEFQPPWTGQAHVSTLNLSRLGRRQGMALAASVAGGRPLSDAVMQEIIDRTDGVPLFLEELTKAVTEADVRGGDVVSTLLSATSVPATLHASLMARLDRLGPVTKEVAQIAAAIGREVSYEVLAAVARKNDAVLRAALNGLNEAGLVSCRGIPPQATFLFKHALVRDAAYGSMLRSQRRHLHASIVAALENLNTEPALLAQHCADAGLQGKAVGYWLSAGQQALKRSTNVEAFALLIKGLLGLENMPEDTWRQRQELEFQIALGQAFQFTRGPAAQETGKAYARAERLCERLDQRDRLTPIIFGVWVHHLMGGELERSRQDAMRMERLAEDEHDPRLKVMGCRLRGQSEFLLDELAAARVSWSAGWPPLTLLIVNSTAQLQCKMVAW